MNTPAIEEHKRRVAILRELAGKHPTWYIAEKIGTTDKAVAMLAVRYGISLSYLHKEWTPEDLSVLIEMRKEGCKFSAIGKVLGRTEQTCANKYRRIPAEDRYGLKRFELYPGVSGAKKDIAYWLLLLKPGESMDLNPEAFGSNVETLQQHVHAINGLEGRRYKCFGGLRKRSGKRIYRPEGSVLRVQAVKQ